MPQENETPSWLSGAAAVPVAAPVTTLQTPVASAPAANAASSLPTPDVATLGNSPVDEVASFAALEQQQLRGVVLYTRLINLAASIAVIVISVLYFIGSLKDPKIMLLAAYSTCGGCLICCLETQLKFIRTSIAMNFGFLFHALFRFLFYMLIASVCFAFRGIMGYIVGGCLVWVAFWNTYVLIKYPAYRGLRDKLAEEEDKRIEGKMREQIRTEATKQMFSR